MAKYETAFLQDKKELDEFAALLAKENVKSYLEIGSKFGGSLWWVALALPPGSRIVSVDLPHGDQSFKDTLPHLRACVDELKARGYDAHLIIGDCTDAKIIEQVYALGPYDAGFIDANHTIQYVETDWKNYSKVCKILAFHDIGFWRKEGQIPGKKPIEVPVVWNRIKKDFRHVEIKRDEKNNNGIGVLWL